MDQTTRDLVRAWSSAWAEILDEYAEAVDDLIKRSADGKLAPRHVYNRAAKAQKAVQHAAERLDELGKQAGVTINGRVVDLVKTADHWTDALALSQMPPGSTWAGLEMSWTTPSDRAIDAIVKRTTQQVESALRPLSRGAEQAMKRELVRGVAAGKNPRVTARRMINRSRGVFDGGLPRAMNIARTEMIDSYRRAADETRKSNSMIKGWIWYATLDHRTCGSCLAMAGTEHPSSESGPHDHQQGRCTAIPLTKSWADLGLDIPEPKPITQDGEAWFNRQSEKVQHGIVGPARLKALQDGKIEFSDLAVRRSNVGWRDSYGMPAVGSL